MENFVRLFLILQLFNKIQGDFTPELQLYEQNNCQGRAGLIFSSGGSVPNLGDPPLNFDDKTYSIAVRGPWILYELANYNPSISPMEYYFYPQRTCINLKITRGHVSSLRSVGDIGDYRIPSLAIYTIRDFQGQVEYALEDKAYFYNYQNQRSLIITGQVSWTLYDHPNYQGNSFCIHPSKSYAYEPSLVASFFDSAQPFPLQKIGSARLGCYQ